jgi:hypothetical protein
MIVCKPPEASNYQKEVWKCRRSPAYFLDTYGHVYDATAAAWIRFQLWPAQLLALQTVGSQRLTVILKARQLGLTWLVLGYALWLLLFRPAATVLLFSRRDEEAVDLLTVRLPGLYERLPAWLQVQGFLTDNEHAWHWSNGSRVLALPTSAGDSYTASLAIVDEADLVPDLAKLLGAVKPTIDGGGRLILLSRADKSKPQSVFKRIYTTAQQQRTDWAALFLPWQARPDRDQSWYQAQANDILQRTGSLDDLYEQYPATDTEALAPRSLDKRIAPEWLRQCYLEKESLNLTQTPAPAIPGLTVYVLPQPGHRYVLGADPAEGNPTSDDSALVVLDQQTGEEVATLSGRLQPSTLAAHTDAVGSWYHHAQVLVERNNHGHAVLLWLRDHSCLRRLTGHDGKQGWLSNSKGKALLYDATADRFREGRTRLHSFATYVQLASIDGSSLRAPEGEHDDRAVAYALACLAMTKALPPPSPPRVLSSGLRDINPHRY